MTELTEQQIRLGIAPRSDQVNADDLLAGPITVTITGTRMGDDKRPWFIDLAEFPKRPFKPGVMMRRLMLEILKRPTDKWVGERMTLYRDPQVKFKGETVGGVRISHFSKVTKPTAVELTASRDSKIEWVVGPIESLLSPEEAVYVKEYTPLIENAATLDELSQHQAVLKDKPQPIRDALRPVYVARYAELKKG